MIKIRKSNERGRSQLGWLDSYFTFSFSDYYDPRFTGFRDLLVINEDRIGPGTGFPTHGHRDMEIITYVLEGALEHKDSLGNGSIIRPGDVQRMSAGTGVRHSEYNHSKSEGAHLLQIWIEPEASGMPPGYEQRSFAASDKRNQMRLIASRDGAEGSVTVHQDLRLYAGLLESGSTVEHRLEPGRHAWVQVARGEVELSGQALKTGDGAALSEEASLTLKGLAPCEVLLFDMK